MAKGWSFGGLIAALKSAAFLNAGTARGEVITVGQKNAQIPTTAFVTNFNFNTYTFTNGEVLYVEMNSAVNVPPELQKWDLGKFSGACVIITVLGISDNSNASILVTHGEAARPPIMYYSRGPSGGRSYTAQPLMSCKDAGSANINLFTGASDVGVYYQESDAVAGSAGGYPAAHAGTLEVLPTAYGVQQRYTSIYGNVWVRSRTLDSSQNWADWRELARVNQRDRITEVGAMELYNDIPYIDFHYANSGLDYTARIIAEGYNQLALRGTGTDFKLFLNGQYRGVTWGRGWGQETDGHVPYGVYNCEVGPDAWVPILTLQTVTSGQGYGTHISFGAYSRNNDFSNPVISRRGDNGAVHNWTFQNDGNIDYTGNGGPFRFARENWVNASFMSDIRLASYQETTTWRGYGYRDESGWVITAVINQTADEFIDYVGRRKLQKYMNGTWYDSYSV
ncbi:hypothetical protein [Escherichia phage Ecp_YSF]|nr:hypothetical protein [Escherichia phage Ecp_YSF]